MTFRETVYYLMSQVPSGKVTTYGDIAGLAGSAYASRAVGSIAHAGPDDLPWHRLVNRFGGLAKGFRGGREVQRLLLETEGIECRKYVVKNFKAVKWQPKI